MAYIHGVTYGLTPLSLQIMWPEVDDEKSHTKYIIWELFSFHRPRQIYAVFNNKKVILGLFRLIFLQSSISLQPFVSKFWYLSKTQRLKYQRSTQTGSKNA